MDVAFFASLQELLGRADRAVEEPVALRARKGELSASGSRPVGSVGLKCPACGHVS
jgi:hypothetical protein